MNNSTNTCNETVTCNRGRDGLLTAIVLYILLVIILSSLGSCY